MEGYERDSSLPEAVEEITTSTSPESPSEDPSTDAEVSSIAQPQPQLQPPSLRVVSPSLMTPSSTPLGQINAARRPGPPSLPTPAQSTSTTPGQSSGLSQDIQAKMKAFSLSRQGGRPTPTPKSSSTGSIGTTPVAAPSPAPVASPVNPVLGGLTSARLPQPAAARPQPPNWSSMPAAVGRTPSLNPAGGLAAKRGLNQGMKLSDAGGKNRPLFQTPGRLPGGLGQPSQFAQSQSGFSKYSEIIDTKTGTIKFKDKAVIHGGGIDFAGGRSFSISLEEVETLDELGKGNYGTVYKVRHCRPRIRRPGLGLRGTLSTTNIVQPESQPLDEEPEKDEPLSNVVMAMKEIRLELDDAKFTAIIMELDILHRCVSPFIIDFYGAFFQEGAVYICVEYMDGGSMEKVYGDGVPENILKKIAVSTIMGLRCLKDEHNIIHRDVKPTNILVNTRGQVKICDFGVSGNLVASIAKTNIGCQSYMAPERIAGGGPSAGPNAGTYSVQSDIWSLGLSLVECATGRYPYPPETYNNIFSQLNAIVQGDPPTLPADGYSEEAKRFVACCLNKNPSLRPSYSTLLRHPWVAELMTPPEATEEEPAGQSIVTDGVDGIGDMEEDSDKGKKPASPENFDTADEEVAEWVREALDKRRRGVMGRHEKPALHKVALDAVPGSPLLDDPTSLMQVQKEETAQKEETIQEEAA